MVKTRHLVYLQMVAVRSSESRNLLAMSPVMIRCPALFSQQSMARHTFLSLFGRRLKTDAIAF